MSLSILDDCKIHKVKYANAFKATILDHSTACQCPSDHVMLDHTSSAVKYGSWRHNCDVTVRMRCSVLPCWQTGLVSEPRWVWCINSLRRREPARPLMTVTAFLGSVQNWSRTGEKASLLLSNCRRNADWQWTSEHSKGGNFESWKHLKKYWQ